MRYAHLRSRMFGVPLLVTPQYAAAVTSGLADKLELEPMLSEEERQVYYRPAHNTVIDKETGIATMPIVGGLAHRGDALDAMSGIQSYTSMQNKIESLFAHKDVRGILLDIDSGGGEGAGLEEFVDFLKTANTLGDVPVWAIANTCAASAAYWLASACDRLYMAPNASVGSIGVYIQHMDVSKAVAKKGVVQTFVYAGAHKLDGNPYEALPENVRADLQERVDGLYETFTSAIAEHRGMSVEAVKATEARMYEPKKAIELGLADGEGTLGDVLSVFAEHVRPSTGGYINGATMSERAIYTQSDLDKARAEGFRDGETKASAAVDGARLEERKKVGAKVHELFPGNARAETFAEALSDGTSIDTAAKFASKHEVPAAEPITIEGKTATQADVDELMKRHSPDLSGGDREDRPGNDREQRLAEIREGGKAHNRARGYITQ